MAMPDSLAPTGPTGQACAGAAQVHDLDSAAQGDYIGLMVTTLRESKAKLSALVEVAARGEEVIITVRGKPRARLCPLVRVSPLEQRGRANWGESLRVARATHSVGARDTGTEILDELLGDRV